MRMVLAPEEYDIRDGDISVFLAGGITGCSEWQRLLMQHLLVQDGGDMPYKDRLVVLNPRRDNFPMGDPKAGKEQIAWEFRHLLCADAISFWFDAIQLQPIVLFELGTRMLTDRHAQPIFVGVHQEYPRKFDVYQQMYHYCGYSGRNTNIVDNLPALAHQILDFVKAQVSR